MALPVWDVQTQSTQGNITLAVSTTGSDTPSANRPPRIAKGDYSAYPFLTIQAAIDSLPLNLIKEHAVIVNVGAGTFAGFQVTGFVVHTKATVSQPLIIQGTRQTAVLATGPSSGTATSGGSRTLTLTGAGWTADDLVGRYVRVTSGAGSGQILLVAENTTDTITFSRNTAPSFAAGSVFVVEDLATVVTSPVAGSTVGIYVYRCTGGRVAVVDFAVASSAPFAFVTSSTMRMAFTRCVARFVAGGNYGFSYGSTYFMGPSNNGAIGAFNTGCSYQGCVYMTDSGFLAVGCALGMSLSYAVSWFAVTSGSYFRNCGTGLVAQMANPWLTRCVFDTCGMPLDLRHSLAFLENTVIDNCTGRTTAFLLSHVQFVTALSGSGNAGFGLNAKGSGNVIELAGFTPTISGASGEVTVDGINDVTWDDLAAPGDYAADEVTGARINRQ